MTVSWGTPAARAFHSCSVWNGLEGRYLKGLAVENMMIASLNFN